jgi:hypothetical protein
MEHAGTAVGVVAGRGAGSTACKSGSVVDIKIATAAIEARIEADQRNRAPDSLDDWFRRDDATKGGNTIPDGAAKCLDQRGFSRLVCQAATRGTVYTRLSSPGARLQPLAAVFFPETNMFPATM